MSSDRLITAPADKVSGAEFFRAIFGPPKMSREEAAERSAAWRECRDGWLQRQPDYRTQEKHDAECGVRYRARLAEIAAKYQLVEVEYLGPRDGRERIAA